MVVSSVQYSLLGEILRWKNIWKESPARRFLALLWWLLSAIKKLIAIQRCELSCNAFRNRRRIPCKKRWTPSQNSVCYLRSVKTLLFLLTLQRSADFRPRLGNREIILSTNKWNPKLYLQWSRRLKLFEMISTNSVGLNVSTKETHSNLWWDNRFEFESGALLSAASSAW